MHRNWLVVALAVVCVWAPGSSRGAAAAQGGRTMRLKRVSSVDRQGMRTEAFSLLVPMGWTFRGGVFWPLQNPAMPANCAFTVTSGNSFERLECFPSGAHFWSTNRMLLSNFPPGSKYLGSEVRAPMSPADYLRQVVIARNRNNVGQLRVVDARPLPKLARQLARAQQASPGAQSSAAAAKVRVEYNQVGFAVEEEFYCVIETYSFPVRTLYGVTTSTNWTASYVFSFKAPKGHLAGNAERFWVMIRSFRINPQWFNKYQQVINTLVQQKIREIRHIGQISRIIAQTNDEISDMMMRSYQQRSAVYDRLADQFSQYIRGVDAYYDPVNQRRVDLPAGYDRGWTNGLGEYVLTDDPNFNPNLDSNQNWTPMRR